ncbi:MAG: CCA tRNA nucleotidyltransferase [Solirubrobacterales bacterium]|nr:CCA tRNA nucleotidyltransferase [Solirubrobacterales bacterium]
MNTTPHDDIDPTRLGDRVDALEGVEELRRAAGDSPLYVVGGAVRDLLLGASGAGLDVDVVAETDVGPIAEALGGETVEHERFSTASARAGEIGVDLARARTETYAHPGALPEVEPAPLLEDLARRDFTVNAMAFPLAGEPELIDPHGGLQDLREGLLRVLHPDSLRDDPTRALRGARYAARLGFEPDATTGRLLRKADLSTVSSDRVDAELRRMAAEPSAERALGLIREWGLLDLPSDLPRLAAGAAELARSEPWNELSTPEEVLLAALDRGPEGKELSARALELAREKPRRASDATLLARDRPGTELLLARALGAEWLDRYASEWRGVGLEIGGADLMAAGVPEGPAVGRGLDAALSAKLDGEAGGRDQELRVALEAAGGTG